MHRIITRAHHEITHFTSMPYTSRLLAISYGLRSIAYPLISIFTSAYIWKFDHDITLLVLYYIGNFAILPIVFMLNKWLLKYLRLPLLYSIGTICTGLSSIMVIFYRSPHPSAYLLYGILYGLGNGLYWANRNFLTLKYTTSAIRGYFTGLQFTVGTGASIIVPALAGWFIVTTHSGYEVLVFTAFGILVIAGLLIQKTSIEHPAIARNDPGPFSTQWQKARLLSVAIGAVDSAIYVLPTVLILTALGNEGILGSINSAMAILTSIISYIFGRKYRQTQFLPIFTAMLAGFVLAGIPLLFVLTPITIVWYLVIAGLADNIIWIANEPKIMDLQDEEVKKTHHTHYQMIVDREWFINLGRVIVLLIMLTLATVNLALSLRVTAVISGVVALSFTMPVLRTKRIT